MIGALRSAARASASGLTFYADARFNAFVLTPRACVLGCASVTLPQFLTRIPNGSTARRSPASTFGVSHETIRRDLKLLADQGHLDVVHGGAARRGMMEPSISQREGENADGKGKIARTAAGMVQEGQSVLIDSGTTTEALTYELVGRPGLP